MLLSRAFFASGADGEDRSPFSDFWFGPAWSGAGGRIRSLSPESASQLSAVYTACKFISESIAQVPLEIRRVVDSGYLKPEPRHALSRLLGKRPNRWQSPIEFKGMMQYHALIRGNAYAWLRYESGAEFPLELVPLHPDRVTPKVLTNGAMRYDYRAPTGETITYQAGEIFHLRGLSSDGYVGMNPIAEQRLMIAGALEIDEYSRRFYANDGQPRGWIEHPGKFKTQDDKSEFVRAWQEAQTGENRGRAAVLEHGLKYHELKVSNEDAQFLETKKFKRSEIFGMFLPSMALDELNQVTYQNSENRVTSIMTFVFAPWFTCWEEAFGRALIDEERYPDLVVHADEQVLLRLDSKARADYFKVAAGPGGWITRNEARLQEGRSPRDDMDAPLAPMNTPRARDGDRGQGAAPGSRGDEDEEPDQPTRQRPAPGRAERIARAAAERVLLRAANVAGGGKADDINGEAFRGFAAKVLGISIAASAEICERIAGDASIAYASGVRAPEIDRHILAMLPAVADYALTCED